MRFIIFVLFLIILGLSGFWFLANKETTPPTQAIIKEVPLPNPAALPAGTVIEDTPETPEEDSGAEE